MHTATKLAILVLIGGCSGGDKVGIGDTQSGTGTGTTGTGTGTTGTGTGTTGTGTGTTGTTQTAAPFSANFLWDDITFGQATDLGHTPAQAATLIDAGSTQLTEVAPAAGLGDAVVGSDTHGVGVGFFDVDGDDWADILLVNGRNLSTGQTYASELWRNNQDGTFTNVSGSSGFEAALDGLSGYSISAADYDADGDLDVLVTGNPYDRLLQNDGAGNFSNVSAAAGIGGDETSPSGNGSKIGSFGDFDNDGWMDIAVVSAQFVDNAQPENGYLMHNNGDGTFTDITATSGFQISDEGNPCALMWSDFDNDGDQDLHVWNDRGNSGQNRTLLQNDGGAFTDITASAGWQNALAGNPMGVDGADINHDGYLDYHIGNIGGSLLIMGSSTGFFLDAATSAGVRGEYTWGLGFEDFNLDGWWDIFVTQEDGRDYLSFTNERVDPPSFLEQGWSHGPWGGGSHNVAAAFADYDHDGDTDILTGGTGGHRPNLFRNDSDRGTNHWLQVRVPVDPSVGSVGGISARVIVQTPERTWFEDIVSGSSRASQSEVVARFGLGSWDGANWVAVLWPDGRQQVVINVPGDQVLVMP